MKFSLVHPSRERVDRAESAFREWRDAAATHAIEHVLSVDADDPSLDGYRALAATIGSTLVVGPNRTMVEAVNRGAAAATGDVLIAIADDYGCPPDWDVALVAAIGGRDHAAVWVHDNIEGRIMTLPILTRRFYERIGGIYHPSYVSMYADDDLTEVARVHGATVDVRKTLMFPHRHASVGLSEADGVHARQNSSFSWWYGWRAFQLRRVDDFGPRKRGLGPAMARARIHAYYRVRRLGAAFRGMWLPHLPAWLIAIERRVRNGVIDGLSRLTVRGPD